ncbi:OmpA family protein [Thiomicrorhabdus sp.]|uniref:OmpA family protein n=1 Tax=Thiomicrorhabdus sp. TaxID=2039724 RepID=UPI0029C8F728|nr:OmpA family protein [Thiomicrorhabdus sp.]
MMLKKYIWIAGLCSLAACSSPPTQPDANQNAGTEVQAGGSGTNPDGVALGEGQTGAGSDGNGVEVLAAGQGGMAGGDQIDAQEGANLQDMAEVYSPIVYFDYDQYALDDKDIDIVKHYANEFLANPGKKMLLKGHTDERGSPEYNLALGEKRGKAVEEAMLLFGVPGSSMEVISFGEEQPANLESNETAWQENRRVEIVIR